MLGLMFVALPSFPLLLVIPAKAGTVRPAKLIHSYQLDDVDPRIRGEHIFYVIKRKSNAG